MTRSSDARSSAGPPWYQSGLCFSCTQCGDCCRHEEGYVWVTRKEIRNIAQFLNLSEAEVIGRYTRQVGRRLSLVEKPNLDCVFWDQGCSIYPVRPTQCRVFPFWPENLESPEAWEEVAQSCPGADQGHRYRVEEIQKLAGGSGETE